MLLTSQRYIRDITMVEPEWLSEVAPHFYAYRCTTDDEPGLERGAKRPRVGEVLDAGRGLF